MYQGYKTIFWGIFFLTFHINIGFLQILPSFMGFVIIYWGIKCILEDYQSPNLYKAKTTTVFAILLSIIGGILDLGLIGFFQSTQLSLLIPISISVIELLLFYYLLTGSVELLMSYNLTEMAESYINKTRIYIILFSFLTIMEIIILIFNIDYLIIIYAMAVILIRIWLMTMCSTLKDTDFKDSGILIEE